MATRLPSWLALTLHQEREGRQRAAARVRFPDGTDPETMKRTAWGTRRVIIAEHADARQGGNPAERLHVLRYRGL